MKIDQFGRIAEQGIHDAQIDEFHFIVNERLDIGLRDPSGGTKLISLLDVVQIGFKDVVNGTIISDVFCWKLNTELIEQSDPNEAWSVLLGGSYLERDFVKLISSLTTRHTGKFLVFFESSYGGAIAAICQNVQLNDKKGI